MTKIEIDVELADGDYSSHEVFWYDPNDVFIRQFEKNGMKQGVTFTWDEAQRVRDALNLFLEARTTALAKTA